jgi:Ca2+-binding RTX toxin-like protein
MKQTLSAVFSLAVLLTLTLGAGPAQAVGPYCDGYCAGYISCSATCYTWGGFKTTCGDWGEEPCGVCLATTYWWGTSGPDTHTGDGSNNAMYGLGGDDSLYGSSGDDVLWGNDDDDSLYGGSGNDCLYGDSGTDSANGNSGHDVCVAESETSCDD